MAPDPERIRREYEATLVGTAPRDGAARCVFLVGSTDFADRGDDLPMAAGMARQLGALGWGVRVVGPGGWYEPQPPGSSVVCVDPSCDPRRVPGRVTVVAWVRDRVGTWLRNPGLAALDAIVAPSEIGRRVIARSFTGTIRTCPIGVDTDLFHPGRSTRRVREARRPPYFERPAHYRSAQVVVAEVSDRAAGYGLLTSRLLEALACDAPAITNRRIGLADAGLGDVPAYSDAAERDALSVRAQKGEYDEPARRLGELVRTRHSLRRRAGDFAAILHEVAGESRPRPIVDFYPDYSNGNPFQTLLYRALTPEVATLVPVTDVVTDPLSRDPGGDLHGRVLHLHWLDRVVQEAGRLDLAIERLDAFRRVILDLKSRGVRVVWTVHNVLPHQVRYYFLELQLCQFVAEQADAIHVMAGNTAALAAPYFRLPPEKIVRLDHPSYDGAYPVVLDRDLARAQLGLSSGEICLLFFGLIREYKGVGRLLDAFATIAGQDARLRLDVVGRVDPPHTEEFVERLQHSPQVRAHLGFVPNDLVQRYLLAADIAVLPFERALNSGSLALAATFGLPVVVPGSPAFADLAGRPMVETFAPGDTASLAEALWRARTSLTRPEAREDARAYAAERDPDTISPRLAREVLGIEP